MTFSREDIALSQSKPVVYKSRVFHFCVLSVRISLLEKFVLVGTVSLGTVPPWVTLIFFDHSMSLYCAF